MRRLTFLGTGTSQGVPIIGCRCPVCLSDDPKDKRLRTSALISTEKVNVVIDAGPDFRFQMLRADIRNVDAILLTHPHRDHVGGLDDVRPFNYYQKHPMPVYGSPYTLNALHSSIPYAFDEHPYPGAPEFELHPVEEQSFSIGDLTIRTFNVLHYKMPVNAYRIDNLTYITDAKFISRDSIEKIKGTKILIVNALRQEPHLSHFSISEALELIDLIGPEQAYLTHTGHTLGYRETSDKLPSSVRMAYDGLSIDF